MDFLNNKRLHLHDILNPLVSNLNKFWSRMKNMILTDMDYTLTVTMQQKAL